MRTIHLSNDRKRNAQVGFESVGVASKVLFHAPNGAPAKSYRLVKAPLSHAMDSLLATVGGDANALSQALVDGDPEIDLQRVGRQLGGADRVLLSPDGQVVHCARVEEIIFNADGTERERRPPQVSEANIDIEGVPLVWSGRLMPRKEVLRKFVFCRKLRIAHVNGLTFDFLFDIAKQLHDKDSFLLLGSGPRGIAPLVFQREGGAYRGFLEGRVKGETYCLMLHLSNLELKAVPV